VMPELLSSRSRSPSSNVQRHASIVHQVCYPTAEAAANNLNTVVRIMIQPEIRVSARL
jgi:hypothetical protein